MEYTRLGPGIRPKMRDAMTEVRNYLFPPQGEVYYVSKRGASGDGKSWTDSFLTITEGVAALSDNDTLFIGPGNYDEALEITLSGKDNIRIFGTGTGFQWGEGATCWRDVVSGADLFTIADSCKSVEIAGIGFVSSQAFNSINLTGVYGCHIHDCSFVGDSGGGAVGLKGIAISGGGGPDTYIHDCRFFHYIEHAIRVTSNQRFVMHDCLIIVPDTGVGVYISAAATTYGAIWKCYFMGTAGDGNDQGLEIAATSSDGKLLVADCRFAGCVMSGGGTGAEVACTENYKNNDAGGTIIDPT